MELGWQCGKEIVGNLNLVCTFYPRGFIPKQVKKDFSWSDYQAIQADLLLQFHLRIRIGHKLPFHLNSFLPDQLVCFRIATLEQANQMIAQVTTEIQKLDNGYENSKKKGPSGLGSEILRIYSSRKAFSRRFSFTGCSSTLFRLRVRPKISMDFWL